MGVEQRVDHRLRRVQQGDELEIQRARREGDRAPRRVPERLVPQELEEPDERGHDACDPEGQVDHRPRVGAERRSPADDHPRLPHCHQHRSPGGDRGREAGHRESGAEQRGRQRSRPDRTAGRKDGTGHRPAGEAADLHTEAPTIGLAGDEGRRADERQGQARFRRVGRRDHRDVPEVVRPGPRSDADSVHGHYKIGLRDVRCARTAEPDRAHPRHTPVKTGQCHVGSPAGPDECLLSVSLDWIESRRKSGQVPVHLKRDGRIPGEHRDETRGAGQCTKGGRRDGTPDRGPHDGNVELCHTLPPVSRRSSGRTRPNCWRDEAPWAVLQTTPSPRSGRECILRRWRDWAP